MPDQFALRGDGKGLQLFFHGMCAFVLPKASGQPLRVAMLNAYPNDVAHRHFASLVIPRGGVDLDASTAEPSGVDGYHLIYGLKDIYVTLSTAGVMSPAVKVGRAPVTACPTAATWANVNWSLDMNLLYNGTRAAWSKVASVSQAQFETFHGSLEQDFDMHEQPSELDDREWDLNGKIQVLKNSVRLRILDPGPVTFVLTNRSIGSRTSVVLKTQNQNVNAAIINLPADLKMNQTSGRLEDALAYYQMFDPSPLNPANPASDAALKVPLWLPYPRACTTISSIECMCCPPSF